LFISKGTSLNLGILSARAPIRINSAFCLPGGEGPSRSHSELGEPSEGASWQTVLDDSEKERFEAVCSGFFPTGLPNGDLAILDFLSNYLYPLGASCEIVMRLGKTFPTITDNWMENVSHSLS
jgi:hypothetical protein